MREQNRPDQTLLWRSEISACQSSGLWVVPKGRVRDSRTLSWGAA